MMSAKIIWRGAMTAAVAMSGALLLPAAASAQNYNLGAQQWYASEVYIQNNFQKDNYVGNVGSTAQSIIVDTLHETAVPGAAAGSTYLVSAGPDHGGTVSAHAEDVMTGYIWTAIATLNFTFQVDGAATGVLVPLHVIAAGSYAGWGEAYFDLFTGGTVLATGDVYNSGANGPTSFSINQDVWVPSGTDLTVAMFAAAHTQGTSRRTGTAFVDPLFSIDDPAYASLYKIVGVPGDGASTPSIPAGVPEPAAWALMLLGLATAGAVLRRRDPAVGASQV